MTFSVITVTYNCADTIEQTIQSVLFQKNCDIEYIVIDGDSSDGTKNILNKYADSFSVFISEKDNGVFNAMNKALTYATGDVISFLNGDDYYISDDVLSYVESILVDSGIEIVDALTSVQNTGIYLHENLDVLLQRMILHHPAMFVRKSVFGKIGNFNEEYRAAADYDWSIRAYLAGTLIKRIYKCTTFFRLGGESSKIGTFVEANRITKNYLTQLKRYDLLEETQEIYRKPFRKMLLQEALNHPTKELRQQISNLLSGSRCIIWGTGELADYCASLLCSNGIDIMYFADNDQQKWGMMKYDIPVKMFDKNEEWGTIFISTWKYENEISIQLEQEGLVHGKDYIKFSDFEDFLIEYCEPYIGINKKKIEW